MLGSLLNAGFDKNLLFFAINNTCNCRCKMCSIWKMKEKKIVKYAEAKKALIKFYDNDFRFLQLTGGEPLLNPDFFRIMKFAKELGFVVFFPTNGTLITKEIAERLAENRIDHVSISFHHFKPKTFEDISGHEGIFKKTLNSIAYLRQAGVPTSVLCTIMKDNYRDIENIVRYFDRLKISISFCTPMIIRETTFALGSEHAKFKKNELKNVISEIIELKGKYKNIVNNIEFLKDVMNFLSDKKSKYTCLGGEKIFYLDWNLNIYPCMNRGKGIAIDEFFNSKRNINKKNQGCDDCTFQCFREPSIFLGSKANAIGALIKDLPSYIYFMKNI